MFVRVGTGLYGFVRVCTAFWGHEYGLVRVCTGLYGQNTGFVRGCTGLYGVVRPNSRGGRRTGKTGLLSHKTGLFSLLYGLTFCTKRSRTGCYWLKPAFGCSTATAGLKACTEALQACLAHPFCIQMTRCPSLHLEHICVLESLQVHIPSIFVHIHTSQRTLGIV